MNKPVFDPIKDVIKSFSQGELIIMIDDENRENEGDLICAAEMITPEIINFMITHGRGLVCVPMEEEKLAELGLLKIGPNYTADKYYTAFMDSVDVRHGTTTGISAEDRAETIKALVSDKSTSRSFMKPGHIFPLKASTMGVLERAGHTEGAVDLAKICGLKPAGVICEILNHDGSMMRLNQLQEFAHKHNLKITSIADIIKYRNNNEQLKEPLVETKLPKITSLTDTKMPTEFGEFNLKLYKSTSDDHDHLALTVKKNKNLIPLVRIHSECMTGDIFKSYRCDCGAQLKKAMQEIQEYGNGAIVYLRQEGRGIGLANKLHAYELQDKGLDTVEANTQLGFKPDQRDYGVGAQILKDIEMIKIKLLTNNPAKEIGLQEHGIEIIERVPLIIPHTEHNAFYMETKRDKMGHLI